MSEQNQDLQMIYMTASSKEEAEKIALVLLEKKLIACANIFPPMQSLYVWEGKLEKSQEVAVIFKSRASEFKRLEETVLGLHSYKTPCLVALSLDNGHPAFLEWIAAAVPKAHPNSF